MPSAAYAAFRHRDYRCLLAGTVLSNFGLQAMNVAVAWDLYTQTRSALVLGNVGFVQVAPFVLFSLFAGHVADRHDRRAVMVLTQAVYVSAALLLLFGFHSVLLIYLSLLLAATARTFQGPARGAVLTKVVPPEALSNAITWSSSGQELANVAGPALAGLLLATLGSRSVYIFQVACGMGTLTAFCLMRRQEFERAAGRGAKTLTEGLRFVLTNSLILPAISLDMFGVLFGGATALLPIFAVDILHAGPKALGLLRAAPSVGATLMAMSLAHAGKIRRAGPALLIAVCGFGLATIAFGLSRNLWLSLALLVAVGAFDNISVVLRHSLVQTKTPDWVRGRVLAVNNIFISCSNQLGAVESGWTAAWFGPVLSVAGGGVATLVVVGLCAGLSPALRKWRQ